MLSYGNIPSLSVQLLSVLACFCFVFFLWSIGKYHKMFQSSKRMLKKYLVESHHFITLASLCEENASKTSIYIRNRVYRGIHYLYYFDSKTDQGYPLDPTH